MKLREVQRLAQGHPAGTEQAGFELRTDSKASLGDRPLGPAALETRWHGQGPRWQALATVWVADGRGRFTGLQGDLV